jgi:transposase
VAVTDTTVVNALPRCELLRAIAAQGPALPVTVVLDNARHQKCALVQDLARPLGIEPLYLPGYAPNRNLIERLGRFIKRDAVYGRDHPTFTDFKAAVEETISALGGKHKEKRAALLTLNFQVFDDVSLLAA